MAGLDPAMTENRRWRRKEIKRYREFDWYPDRSPGGPVLIIVSLPEQLVHVYRNGVRIGASTCSTGKPGHSTPTGVFKILQKDKNHHSSTYNDAPMPNMNRLTWSGIALHAGQLPGYPASHGCVRLPKAFSALLFGVTRVGMTVVIADDASQPVSVTHPGMVLGEYAAREFNAVDTAIKATEYSEGHEPAPHSPSVVVSSADKSIAVFDNSTLAASGKVEIADPQKPLGERVFTLTGAGDLSDDLRWEATDLSPRAAPPRDDNIAALRRIKADPAAREAVRKRLKFGMTVVTTDGPANAKTRSGPGFRGARFADLRAFHSAGREPHRRRRQASDPFGAAGEAELLAGRRLDRDPAGVDAGDLGDPGAHRLAVRPDLRRFADQRRVEMDDGAAARPHPLRRVGEKDLRRRALPLRVGGREVLADVAIGEGAVERVGERVERDVGVGMAAEAGRHGECERRRATRRRRARRRGRRSPGRPASRSRRLRAEPRLRSGPAWWSP